MFAEGNVDKIGDNFDFRPHIIIFGLKKDNETIELQEIESQGFQVLAKKRSDDENFAVMVSLNESLLFKLVLMENISLRSELGKYSYVVSCYMWLLLS